MYVTFHLQVLLLSFGPDIYFSTNPAIINALPFMLTDIFFCLIHAHVKNVWHVKGRSFYINFY